MLLAALLASQVPLTRRHIDTLSDAEICEAFQEMSARPDLRFPSNEVVEFAHWTVDCSTQTFKIDATILHPLLEPDQFQATAASAPFCRRDNIQRFLERGWKIQMPTRFPDGRRITIRFCA